MIPNFLSRFVQAVEALLFLVMVEISLTRIEPISIVEVDLLLRGIVVEGLSCSKVFGKRILETPSFFLRRDFEGPQINSRKSCV